MAGVWFGFWGVGFCAVEGKGDEKRATRVKARRGVRKTPFQARRKWFPASLPPFSVNGKPFSVSGKRLSVSLESFPVNGKSLAVRLPWFSGNVPPFSVNGKWLPVGGLPLPANVGTQCLRKKYLPTKFRCAAQSGFRLLTLVQWAFSQDGRIFSTTAEVRARKSFHRKRF
jgi:hypothetical protein